MSDIRNKLVELQTQMSERILGQKDLINKLIVGWL